MIGVEIQRSGSAKGPKKWQPGTVVLEPWDPSEAVIFATHDWEWYPLVN